MNLYPCRCIFVLINQVIIENRSWLIGQLVMIQSAWIDDEQEYSKSYSNEIVFVVVVSFSNNSSIVFLKH